jgi:deoxyribose-phosphate aldolase
MTQTRSVADVTVETVTGSLEHLILSPDQTFERIEQTCREAADYDLAAVCLPPYAVPLATRILKGTPVTVCGAVGMPFGHSGRRAKCDEAAAAIEAGMVTMRHDGANKAAAGMTTLEEVGRVTAGS